MGRRYPELPVVGVGAVVLAQAEGRIWALLIQRGAPPAQGIWSIPGGRVELGEGLSEACAREVAEETGLAVEVGPLVEVVERLQRDETGRIEYHYVLLDYLCRAPLDPAGGRRRRPGGPLDGPG